MRLRYRGRPGRLCTAHMRRSVHGGVRTGYRPRWQLGSRTPAGTAPSRASSSTPTRCFEEMTDDLLYHGDVNAALRRMMQQGLRDRNGERLQGMRELLEKLRQRAPGPPRPLRPRRRLRRDRRTSSPTSSTRSATRIDNAVERGTPSAPATSGARRSPRTRADDRNCASTCCPTTSPARSASCRHYDFDVARGVAALRGADGPAAPAALPASCSTR